MTTQVREVVVTEPGQIQIDSIDEVAPGAGDAVVRMSVVGVCGSDVHASHGLHPFIQLPYRPGHEVVGVVESAPEGTFEPGTRVVVNPVNSCGTCKYCREGRFNLCATLTFFGCGTPHGGLADRFVIPARQLLPLPETLSDLQAVLVEPLATPVHAAGLVGELTGKSVVILGGGTIGLLTLAVARHKGARRVVVTDVAETKRARALRLGADAVFDPAEPDVVAAMRDDAGTSVDVVFDCVSIQSTVDQAIALAVKGGTVVSVGVPSGPVVLPLPQLQDLQVRLQGSAMFTRDDFLESMAMIEAGLVRPDDFVTASFAFEDSVEAFRSAWTGEQVKVVVRAGAASD